MMVFKCSVVRCIGNYDCYAMIEERIFVILKIFFYCFFFLSYMLVLCNQLFTEYGNR